MGRDAPRRPPRGPVAGANSAVFPEPRPGTGAFCVLINHPRGAHLGAIGVVYGDIGTSVLYAVGEVFGSGHVEFTPKTSTASCHHFLDADRHRLARYVVLVLRADNNGEGASSPCWRWRPSPWPTARLRRHGCWSVGIFGTSSVLRRRRDHAGDLGAVGGRGPGGGLARRSRGGDTR